MGRALAWLLMAMFVVLAGMCAYAFGDLLLSSAR